MQWQAGSDSDPCGRMDGFCISFTKNMEIDRSRDALYNLEKGVVQGKVKKCY